MRVFFAVALSLLLCCPPAAVPAEAVQRVRRKVQVHQEGIGEVQEKLEKSRNQIQVMQQRERLILDHLDQMERQLELFREELEALKGERASLRLELTRKQERLEQLSAEQDSLRLLLQQRLTVLYKFGRQGYLNLLVSAQDVNQFQTNWLYLRAIVEQDSRLIHQFQENQEKERRLTQALAFQEERVNKLVTEMEKQQAKIEGVQRQQVALLQDIHNQEEMHRQYVEELVAVSQELQRKLGELQWQAPEEKSSAPRPTSDFASNKGALPYPVAGEVVSSFGTRRHEKFGTKIRNNGIEIATRPLSPAAAVYHGQVLFSSWLKGYGNVIIIDHGDKYYTLTAHLAEVAKEAGAAVGAGEVIGYAGYAPGDGEDGRVYFEIRHGGQALNPQSWLLPALVHAGGSSAQ